MKTFIVICFLISTIPLFAQQQGARESTARQTQKQIKSIQQNSIDIAAFKKTKSINSNAKSEANRLKTSVKEIHGNVKSDTLQKPDGKKTAKSGEKVLEKKATNLNYDSENPDDAPWKKKQFSEQDLKELELPSLPNNKKLPGLNDDKVKAYQDQLKDLKSSPVNEEKLKEELSKTAGTEEIDKAKQTVEKVKDVRSLDKDQLSSEASKLDKSGKLAKAQIAADSVLAITDRIEATSLEQELMNAKQVYSQKYIEKIRDSLGLQEAEKMLNLASKFAKSEVPKEELLQKLNTPIKEQTEQRGIGFDEKSQSLTMADADKLTGLHEQASGMPNKLSEMDLSSLKLPQEALSELKPLTGKLLDSKYLPYIDSARQVAMKAKAYKLDEKQITEEVKSAALKKKLSFLDKSYLEGILGYVNDSTISIVQIAPAWGYHFTDNLSVGLGPNFSLEYQQKKVNAVLGFRSFAKAEFWKQRVYVQVEDNFSPSKINREMFNAKTSHSLLVGGGGLLPLSRKLGINVSVLYRVNQQDVRPGGSPWVFRIGLSSIKKIQQD